MADDESPLIQVSRQPSTIPVQVIPGKSLKKFPWKQYSERKLKSNVMTLLATNTMGSDTGIQQETYSGSKTVTIESIVGQTGKSQHGEQYVKKSNLIVRDQYVNPQQLMDKALRQINDYKERLTTQLLIQLKSQANIPQAICIMDQPKLAAQQAHDLFKLPPRPQTPPELQGRSKQQDWHELIINTNVKKSDEANTLEGRYEVTHTSQPSSDYSYGIRGRHGGQNGNSGQLHPLNSFKRTNDIETFLVRLLNLYFDDMLYDSVKCKANSLALADHLKDIFKQLGYERYRIICQVFIGQHLDQTIICASRCLWDKSLDGFLEKKYCKGTLFAVALIYFIYKE
ncbi:unnamed protein product [Didymodactylos carnosus]|uniref:Uncharacterized protein n=1 Tax=Didymodactylos carnosus TaxID=1234261 RepID=A0A815TVG8_9BILA|nr:unnamed protein product [Didymodactylos carnosus]CAF1508073.1 unnamed protein product [Didymodactylos carnosus]CAF4051993.1 unnamed protein product [Didymodactylos carnosus]CAF4369040.1 unnamed protein product [Didymodactylos carnosus]